MEKGSLFPAGEYQFLLHGRDYTFLQCGMNERNRNFEPWLEKTLESPLDCKEIQPVHSEEDQPWDFFGRNDAKAETPELWPPHVKS